MRTRPIKTSELSSWMDHDWLEILHLAEEGGLNQRPRDEVIKFVISSVEPGLREGLLRVGRVFATGYPARFQAIDQSADTLLELIREKLSASDLDPIELDLWLDTVPGHTYGLPEPDEPEGT